MFIFSFDENGEFKSVRFFHINVIKSSIMIITCVCILMVDFPLLFDRYNCKAEDYGWAMMDIGVSAVMFASGFSTSLIVQHKIPSKKQKSLLVELV